MKFFEHESSTSWIKKKISWEFTKNYFIQVRNSPKNYTFHAYKKYVDCDEQ